MKTCQKHSKHFRIWLFISLLVVGILVAASGGGVVSSKPALVVTADQVIISEFRPIFQDGPNNDFVELFNPTSRSVPIGGLLIQAINATNGWSIIYTIPAAQSLSPGQHYLVAGNAYSGTLTSTSNGTFDMGGIPADGGVVITLSDESTVIDKAGTNILSAEGTPLEQLSTADQSYQRKAVDSVKGCTDTNINFDDFTIISPADPQNLDVITPCPGAPVADTDTPIPSDTFTPTATPSSARHVVISEFRTRGSHGADDEFVELYNPTGAAVNISNWLIRRSPCLGASGTNLFRINSNIILLAGQHFLAATSISQIPSPNQVFSPGIADDGGIAVFDLSGNVVDQVGMCISTLYREGTNLQPLIADTTYPNRSYERLPGGSTSCYDLDNNAADFIINPTSDPQNMSVPIVMCAGVQVYTPTMTPTRTTTRTPTPSATTLPGAVVINEFLPHPHTDWNGDGIANTGDEYIELINMGPTTISLKNWKLDNGYGGPSKPYVLPDVSLLSRQIVRFFHSDTGIGLSDAGGTVRLLKPDGRTGDIFNYPLVEAMDVSWCRLPDGRGPLAFVCYPTPGRLNALLASGTPSPTPPEGGGGVNPVCVDGTVSPAILLAECEGPGAMLWQDAGSWAYWLKSRGKWIVFIE